MENVLYFTTYIEPFTTEAGILFQPVVHELGYIVPIGWESELNRLGVEFQTIELPEQSGPHL
jgi:hypothetical protein